MSEIGHEDFIKAFDRIARTDDGYLLYMYFQKALCGIPTQIEGRRALAEDFGRRKFAHDLMALMGKGIRESGRPESAVTFTVAGPRAVAPASGPGRIRAALAAQSDAEPSAGTG